MNLNEGVFDLFSKKQRVLNALIKARTKQRDAADDKSDQLGLSMNTYLNHRDASRTADDRIEKLKLRKKGERGRDYTDKMNAGALEWFKKEKKKGKKKKKQTNEETLHELHKKTIQSLIKGREQQADIAWDHSQTAKKAWLGNSRKTGIWDPVVPRVVGQIGKIGQHNDALLQTAEIFNQRYERAKASAEKAKLRLSGERANTMQNEEYAKLQELKLPNGGLDKYRGSAIRRQFSKFGNIMRSETRRENAITKHAVKFGAIGGAALTAGSLTGPTPHPGAMAVGAGAGAIAMGVTRAYGNWKAKRAKDKEGNTMQNEEVVTEGKWLNRLRAAAIVTGATVLGAGLGGLKHATLKNNEQQGGRQVHGSSNTFVGAGAGAGLAAGVGANEVVGGGATLAAMLARRRAKRNEEYTQVLEQMIISLTGIELEELHEAVGLTGATPRRANAVLKLRLGQYNEKKKIGDVQGAEKAYARWDRTATLVDRRERWPMPVPAALKNRNYWNL